MDREAARSPGRRAKRRRKGVLVAVVVCVAVVLLVLVVVVPVAVLLGGPAVVLLGGPADRAFRAAFLETCEKFPADGKRPDCAKVWSAFEQAYVGRDPCQVPMEAYNQLLSTAPPQPACNRMIFWSGTNEVAHQVSEGCYQTMEDTLLGSVLNGRTWCGKEGSNDTYTSKCPGWSDCDNNPVKSFWRRASAEFATVACGNTSALLSGSVETPFRPTSIFASIEVKKFSSDRMKTLTVVLVTKDIVVANCTNASLKDLKKELDPGIRYICKEVTESELHACRNVPDRPCGSCW